MFDPQWVLGEGAGNAGVGFRDVLVEGVLSLTLPEVGAESRQEFVVYAGPKSEASFGPGDEEFAGILKQDLGYFDGIAGVILGFLRFLHGIVGNWGVAIILLTLTVRALLFPLNRRMQTSMARHATKMKRVQPKIDAIKKKYEKDPQKLRQEQARIFQEEGAMPPLGGCLPILLQIPIFFGLFSALRVAFELRQQPFFGWIRDLSQPDRLVRISADASLPLIGSLEYFNILPILMVVLWVGQQKVMPKPPADNEQARQMQKIMMWMPIMFGFFLYNYAAGLSLYMITTSAFGIIESTVIRKIWPIDDTEKPKKKGKFMQRLEELQKQAVAQQEMRAREQAKNKKKGR
ncbi:MAG: membrane protein insertase YidC [Planctomycetota bacterium]